RWLYTLSLHDALPILSGGGGGSICRLLVAGTADGTGRGESTCSRIAAKSFLPNRARSAWSGDSPSRLRVIQSGTSLKTTVFPMRDRKSTRLNSSHEWI